VDISNITSAPIEHPLGNASKKRSDEWDLYMAQNFSAIEQNNSSRDEIADDGHPPGQHFSVVSELPDTEIESLAPKSKVMGHSAVVNTEAASRSSRLTPMPQPLAPNIGVAMPVVTELKSSDTKTALAIYSRSSDYLPPEVPGRGLWVRKGSELSVFSSSMEEDSIVTEIKNLASQLKLRLTKLVVSGKRII